MWQDYALTIAIYIFVICTIPLVYQVFKKKGVVTLYTAIPTAAVNYFCAWLWTTFPEPMWLSLSSSSLIGTLWLLIAVGSWKNMNKQ